ncbi:DUF1294 domain-containing protein [Phenylobacterium kunshanense]|nr:DUF1294 domain-containing protein [Phenylobacterium kunshanense]
MAYALTWLALMNLMAFGAFADDKRRAVRGARRIPEQTLLSLAAMGGSLGALIAQQLLRHKTRKQPFRTNLILIAAGQAAAAAALLWALAD